jgi:type I restriction enzyme M protein
MGSMLNRRNRELTDEDISQIANTYHAWREGDGRGNPRGYPEYEDIPGFCKSATIEEVRQNNFVLMPGRYVGTEEIEDDGIPFEEKMATLTAQLAEQFEKGNQLQETIRQNLKGIGYEF